MISNPWRLDPWTLDGCEDCSGTKPAGGRAKTAPPGAGARGRRPDSPTARAVKTLTRLMEQQRAALAAIPEADALTPEQVGALATVAASLRALCSQVVERLGARLEGGKT